MVCYSHLSRITESGCLGHPTSAWMSEDVFFRIAVGWKCCGMNTPGRSPQTRTLGDWGITSPAPSPIGWDDYETCALFHFPDFSCGVKLQLPTAVAGSIHASGRLPSPCRVIFPLLCYWCRNLPKAPTAAESPSQALLLGEATVR